MENIMKPLDEEKTVCVRDVLKTFEHFAQELLQEDPRVGEQRMRELRIVITGILDLTPGKEKSEK